MSLRELKFSNQIQEEQIKSVYHKNFNYIVTERFYFQQQWLHAAYNRFKDFDKYLILIHLVHKTFKAYGDYQIKNSFDEFYAKETYEIPKINVIDLSRELLISKETTRRKILEMERDGAIKKDKKKNLAKNEKDEQHTTTTSEAYSSKPSNLKKKAKLTAALNRLQDLKVKQKMGEENINELSLDTLSQAARVAMTKRDAARGTSDYMKRQKQTEKFTNAAVKKRRELDATKEKAPFALADFVSCISLSA